MNTELLVPQSDNTSAEVSTPKVDRRNFMTWVVATPAALTIGVKLATDASDATAAETTSTELNAYLAIRSDNKVVLTIPRVESGQGILTSLAILLADAVGISVNDIVAQSFTTAKATAFTTTLVGASGSTRLLADPVRTVGAELRARMLAVGGEIASGANGPTAGGKTFASLAGAAAAATLGSRPVAAAWEYGKAAGGSKVGGILGTGMTLRGNSADFVPGTGIPRIDSEAIYNGSLKYTVDTNQDALNVLVMHSLQTRGTPKNVDRAAILALTKEDGTKLVKEVIPFNSNKNGFTLYTGVGLVADTMGDALEARDKIMAQDLITWNQGTASRFSTPMLNQKLKDAVGPDPAGGKLLAAKQVKRGFLVGFHAQGTLGTQAGVAEAFGAASGPATGLEAWWASQVPRFNRQQLAQQVGLDLSPTKVLLHVTQGYGHFGRNLLCESSAESARIADAVRKMGGLTNKNGKRTNKIKVMWSRNDDLRMCPYRPPTFSRYIANIGSDGKTILSLNHKFVSILCELPSGVDNTPTETLLAGTNQTGFDYFPLSAPSPYSFTTTEAFREVVAPFPTGAMRAVYSVSGQGGKEIFLDELARKTGQNRFDLRMKYFKSERIKGIFSEMSAKYKAVEAAVAAHNAAGGATVRGLGFGCHEEWNSASMSIVLSEFPRNGNLKTTPPRVIEVWAGLDMGKVTNPSGGAAQAEGALADAIAMVYFSKITFTDGAADQSTFLNYYWNRMLECDYKFNPVTFVNVNDNRVGGAGELSAPAAFAAVANAWADINRELNPGLESHMPEELPIYKSPTAPLTDA